MSTDNVDWTPRNVDVLRACIDAGARNLKIHGQHVQAGNVPNEQYIREVKLAISGMLSEVDLRIIYDETNTMLMGKQVSSYIRRNPDKAEAVLEQFKLALCPQYRNTPVVRRAFKALGIPTGDLPEIQMIYTDLLRVCGDGIRTYMRSCYRELPMDWDTIEIELQLTVPVMWDGLARGVMRNAANNAGFKKTVLRSEPLCAAARYIYDGWKHGRVKVDDVFLFCDIGGGTVDVSTVRVEEPAIEGTHPQIAICGKSHGDLVGSQLINDIAWEHISSVYGADIARLELDEALSHQQFTNCFETCKQQFPDSDAGYRIRFYGSPNGRNESKHIDVTEEQMERWFREAARQINSLLTTHLEQNSSLDYQACVVTGGGAKNQFTFERLEEHLRFYNMELLRLGEFFPGQGNHISHGGLLAYLENPSSALPRNITFYYGRGDPSEFESQRVDGSSQMRTVRRCTRENLVPVFALNGSKNTSFNTVEADFDVGVEDQSCARLRIPIYSSQQNNKKGTSPFYDDGTLKEGLMQWPLVCADLPDLRSRGYTTQKAPNRAVYYPLKAVIRMIRQDDHLEVQLQLLAPNELFASQKCKRTRPRILLERSQEIWASDRSHSVSHISAPTSSILPQKRRAQSSGDVDRTNSRRYEAPTPGPF